jgi:hypothetical protein
MGDLVNEGGIGECGWLKETFGMCASGEALKDVAVDNAHGPGKLLETVSGNENLNAGKTLDNVADKVGSAISSRLGLD